MVVIGGWIRNVPSETCDGTEQVGTSHNSDQRMLAENRYRAMVALFERSPRIAFQLR
jgi:hypothetical protein